MRFSRYQFWRVKVFKVSKLEGKVSFSDSNIMSISFFFFKKETRRRRITGAKAAGRKAEG